MPHPNYGVWASIRVPGKTLPPMKKSSNLITCNYLFHNSYAMIAPIGTSCLSQQCCSMQVPAVDKTLNFFSPGASHAPSGAVKGNQKGVF